MAWKRNSFWWSRQLFPAAGDKSANEHLGGFGLLMLAAGLLFFSRPDCPLQEPQEPRYAEIARQMLAEGSWLVPVLHGQPYYDKPPLFYWLIMASYQVFGIRDWAARLVPATAGFLCVLVTYWWGRRTVGPQSALLGAFILCLSPRFIQLGRMVLMDGPLCLCVATAWATGHVALKRAAWSWWVLSAVACGLGILTKGPVALVLVLVPLVGWHMLGHGGSLRSLTIPPVAHAAGSPGYILYLLIALAVAAPWFVLVALRDPQFLSYFFWFHHVERFVTPFDHQEPFWYYLPVLLLGIMPWTLLLPGLVRLLASRSKRWAARRPAELGFFLLAFAFSFGFFSAAGCKRPAYILVTMPPLALALGTAVSACLPSRQSALALLQHRSAGACRLALAALLLGLAGAVGSAISGLIDWTAGGWLAAMAGGGIIALIIQAWRRGPAIPWAATGLAAFLVMLLAVHQVLPGYSERFAYRDLVYSQAAGPEVPVACYPRRYDSVSFYLQRNDVAEYDDIELLMRNLESRPKSVLFLRAGKGGTALADLLRRLPPSLEFTPEGREGSLMGGRVTRVAP